jgi:hypothetical protein
MSDINIVDKKAIVDKFDISLLDKLDNETIIKLRELIDKNEEVKKMEMENSCMKLALKFVNILLSNMCKENITDLIKFQNITNVEISKEEHLKSIDLLENELLEVFTNEELKWNRRGTYKNYTVILLRCICKKLGYTLQYKEKKKQIKNVMAYTYYYHIIKNI